MKIYVLRRQVDGLYLAGRSQRWVADECKARIFGRKQDAIAAIRAYPNGRADVGEIEVVERVCLAALPPATVYVALPIEGDGVLGDWLEQYGLTNAAMAVRNRKPSGEPL